MAVAAHSRGLLEAFASAAGARPTAVSRSLRSMTPTQNAALVTQFADRRGLACGRHDELSGRQQGSRHNGFRRLRPVLFNVAHIRAHVQPLHASFSTSAASAVAPAARLLVARTATRENFGAFGDLVTPSADGAAWNKTTDATLEGFDGSCGVPRLYLMELTGPRPLSFDRITHHARVTQCLGAASAAEDFYLAVHMPTLRAEGDAAPPDPARIEVFRIAPHNFVKLHKGTWHAGPLWGDACQRIFYNLELHDTNETDHTTFVFAETFAFERCA